MKKLFSLFLGFMLFTAVVYSANTTFTNGTGISSTDSSGTFTVKVDSAAVSENDTTHYPTCADVYDVTGTLFGSASIKTPSTLGTTPFIIQPALTFPFTISTMTFACSGGTNVVFMIEQRTKAAFNSAGTDVFTGDVTASTTTYSGGTFNDATVPSGSALYGIITSVSGSVDMFEIQFEGTKD